MLNQCSSGSRDLSCGSASACRKPRRCHDRASAESMPVRGTESAERVAERGAPAHYDDAVALYPSAKDLGGEDLEDLLYAMEIERNEAHRLQMARLTRSLKTTITGQLVTGLGCALRVTLTLPPARRCLSWATLISGRI